MLGGRVTVHQPEGWRLLSWRFAVRLEVDLGSRSVTNGYTVLTVLPLVSREGKVVWNEEAIGLCTVVRVVWLD